MSKQNKANTGYWLQQLTCLVRGCIGVPLFLEACHSAVHQHWTVCHFGQQHLQPGASGACLCRAMSPVLPTSSTSLLNIEFASYEHNIMEISSHVQVITHIFAHS